MVKTDFKNIYEAFMHCDTNKLKKEFAAMYSDNEEQAAAVKEVNRAFARIDKQVDKIVYAAKEPSRGVYLLRDRHLVDCSAYCISYCTRNTGGTAYTVKYALEHGVTVYNASSFDVSALLQAQPLGKNEQVVPSHKI